MQSSKSVQQVLGGQEFNLEVSGFSNQSGLDLVLTLDPSLLICPKCTKDKAKVIETTTPTNKASTLSSSYCPDCEKIQEILGAQASNVLEVTGDFLEQLQRTKLKLIEAEKAASNYLENRRAASNKYEVSLILPPPGLIRNQGIPGLYRSESSLYINSPDDQNSDWPETCSVASSSETLKDIPGSPDSAFYGSHYSRENSSTSPRDITNSNSQLSEKTIYFFEPNEPDPSIDLDDLKTLSRELSGENTALSDELHDTKSKITDLRNIANLLKLSLQGELKPDPFNIRVGSEVDFNCDSCAAAGHIHCIPKHRLRQQMRIVLNNFEKTILEMLENNKQLFDKMKIKYRDAVEENPEIGFVSYKQVWSRFIKLSETMRGITCSVLYLVSRALEDWMLFSWGFIAWAWPTLVLISNRLLEKLYPRVSAIKAFVSSEPFCAFAQKWNEGQSLATCFKELETEAFLSTVCRISVSFVSICMTLPDEFNQ